MAFPGSAGYRFRSARQVPPALAVATTRLSRLSASGRVAISLTSPTCVRVPEGRRLRLATWIDHPTWSTVNPGYRAGFLGQNGGP